MNWMLTEIPRGSLSSSVPLVRMGTEYKKKHTVHRLFDHIALSILWGEGMKVRLEDQYRTEEYSEPVCVIALPGDNRKMIPLEPFNEIFFVYGASMLQKVLPNLPDDPALFERVIPLKNVEVAAKTANFLSASKRSQILQNGSSLQFNGKVPRRTVLR